VRQREGKLHSAQDLEAKVEEKLERAARVRFYTIPILNADPDQTFPDPDLALLESDVKLRLMFYRSSRAPFLASTPPLRVSTAPNGSILILLNLMQIQVRIQRFILIWIRIQIPKIMRIRIRNPACCCHNLCNRKASEPDQDAAY
jgi:hypothetical protein